MSLALKETEQAGVSRHKDQLHRILDASYRQGYNAGRLEARSEAYKTGFLTGENVGLMNLKRARDRALGVGVLVGTGLGVVLAVVVGSSL